MNRCIKKEKERRKYVIIDYGRETTTDNKYHTNEQTNKRMEVSPYFILNFSVTNKMNHYNVDGVRSQCNILLK